MPNLTLTNIQRGLRLVRMLDFDPKASLGPLRVDIAATSACNYRCQFCGSHSPLLATPVKAESLSLSVLCELLADLRQLGTREVLFAGNGEPLLSDAMKRVVMANDGYFRFEILTNGSLLNTVSEAMFAKLSKLTVSLNSGNGNSHPEIHGYSGANQFLRIIGEIQRLVKYKDGQKKVELNYVETKDNQGETIKFMAVAMWLGVQYHIRMVDGYLFPELAAASHGNKLRSCYLPLIQPCIMADGSVLQCSNFCQSETLGNLYNKPFREIWQSPKAREMRMKAATMPQTQKPITQGCYGCPNAKASSESFNAVYSRIPILGRRK